MYVKLCDLLQSPLSWTHSIFRLHALSLALFFALMHLSVWWFAVALDIDVDAAVAAADCVYVRCSMLCAVYCVMIYIYVPDKQKTFGAAAAAVAAVVDALHEIDEFCCRFHVEMRFTLFICSLTLFSYALTFSPICFSHSQKIVLTHTSNTEHFRMTLHRSTPTTTTFLSIE